MYFTITSEVHTFRALYEYSVWKPKSFWVFGFKKSVIQYSKSLEIFTLKALGQTKVISPLSSVSDRRQRPGESDRQAAVGNERERDRLCVCVYCAPQDWALNLPADTLHHKRPNAISHAAFFCLHTNTISRAISLPLTHMGVIRGIVINNKNGMEDLAAKMRKKDQKARVQSTHATNTSTGTYLSHFSDSNAFISFLSKIHKKGHCLLSLYTVSVK